MLLMQVVDSHLHRKRTAASEAAVRTPALRAIAIGPGEGNHQSYQSDRLHYEGTIEIDGRTG